MNTSRNNKGYMINSIPRLEKRIISLQKEVDSLQERVTNLEGGEGAARSITSANEITIPSTNEISHTFEIENGVIGLCEIEDYDNSGLEVDLLSGELLGDTPDPGEYNFNVWFSAIRGGRAIQSFTLIIT